MSKPGKVHKQKRTDRHVKSLCYYYIRDSASNQPVCQLNKIFVRPPPLLARRPAPGPKTVGQGEVDQNQGK